MGRARLPSGPHRSHCLRGEAPERRRPRPQCPGPCPGSHARSRRRSSLAGPDRRSRPQARTEGRGRPAEARLLAPRRSRLPPLALQSRPRRRSARGSWRRASPRASCGPPPPLSSQPRRWSRGQRHLLAAGRPSSPCSLGSRQDRAASAYRRPAGRHGRRSYQPPPALASRSGHRRHQCRCGKALPRHGSEWTLADSYPSLQAYP
mmetsp:Transcript_86494/g.253159  ORF Transcript_86494/g.253159 Transcript_86494/m.253159 type:complete len:205 (+) Transcript_86494:299-913(+)